jgi:hypothetical protein
MVMTAFLPFFVVLAWVSMRSPRHWLAATGFACFLQGASPFLVTAGGRLAGIAPAYLLAMIGAWHYVRERMSVQALRAPAPQGWFAPTIWLWTFTIVGVVGAVFLPRVFHGVAHAMLSRGSINTAAVTPVSPGGTNIIQAFYLVMNLVLFYIAATLVAARKDGLEWAMKGVGAGLLFACVLGLYQVVAFYTGLPWPADIINSNAGVGQFPDQMAGSLKRITSTFWEPSLLGYSFVGCLGIFLLGGRHIALGLLALCVLLLSTSSLGYFGLAALVLVWIFSDRAASARMKWRVALSLAAVCVLFVVADQVFLDGVVLEDLVLNKAESSSGVGRSTADRLALVTFMESGGLGVGVGTTRASSFAATLLATTGLPGFIAFMAFAYTLVNALRRAGDRESRELGLGLTGFVIVWIIAIPDLVQALFWMLAGVATGHLQRQPAAAAEPAVAQPAQPEGLPWPAT